MLCSNIQANSQKKSFINHFQSSGEGWFVLKHITNPLLGTMKTKASDWSWIRMSNLFLFYATLWAAPFLAIATYTNVFIGPAKLQPIPEGYEPREEEYERHPITRWMAKNYHLSEQQKHEMELHGRWEAYNEALRKQLFAEVKSWFSVFSTDKAFMTPPFMIYYVLSIAQFDKLS